MLSPYQQKKLERLARIEELGEIGVAEEINALEDTLSFVDATAKEAHKKADKALEIAQGVAKKDGPQGIQGEKGDKGDKGDAYILTQTDKKEIAAKLPPKIVEKVIEKTTEVVIKEQPIVTNQIIESKFDPSTLEGQIAELEAKFLAKVDELRRSYTRAPLIGGRAGIQVLSSGVKKGTKTNEINFTGATVTDTNGRITVAISSGSGFQVPLSGVVDGVNQTFVWATAPNVIVVDQGRQMQKVSSSPDLTINWTGTTTTVLTIAPNFDIFATA